MDIDNQKMENVAEPVEDGDVMNKKYVDEVAKSLTLEEALVRENGGYNIDNAYINMNFNNIRNLGEPSGVSDAATRGFVEEIVETNLKRVENRFNELNQLVSVVGSCYESLKFDDYQFTFGGPILNGELNELDKFNGFLVPANGLLKNFISFSTGLIANIPEKMRSEFETKDISKILVDLYGNKDNATKIFSLVKIEEMGREVEELGDVFFSLTNIVKFEDVNIGEYYSATSTFEFKLREKYLNKEENFICSVNRGDIINIRSEYSENRKGGPGLRMPLSFVRDKRIIWVIRDYYLHTATLTFLFKEMSFPSVLE